MKTGDTLYNTIKRPAWWQVGIISLEQLVVFVPLIIFPALTVIGTTANSALVLNTISMSLIGTAIATLLLSFREGGGYFLPISSATQLFAASLLAMHTDDLGAVFGMSMISGGVILIMSLFFRYLHFIFNLRLAGFITMLLGIWVAVLGVDALFFPRDLTPLIFHGGERLHKAVDIKQTLIGFISLAVMLGYRLFTSSRHRMNCILYGSAVGWIIAFLTNQINPSRMQMLKHITWWHWPHPYSLVGYHFNTHLLLPFILGGILISLQVFSMLVLIDRESGEDLTKLNYSRISKGNFAAGLGTLISSALGSPQAPNPAAFGAQYATGVYSRQVAYVVSAIAFILAFSPKVAAFFLTIPAAVRGASIMFLGAGMFMAGFEVISMKKTALYGTIFCLALLLGASFSMIPEFYQSTTVWIKGVTDPTFLVAVTTFIILSLLTGMQFKRKKSNRNH